MPIYEYRCKVCGARTSVLFPPPERPDPRCPRCRGADLARLMSRFATVRFEESHLESLADPSGLGNLDESDPRSVARWMRRAGKVMGEELERGCEEVAAGEPGEMGAGAVTTGTTDTTPLTQTSSGWAAPLPEVGNQARDVLCGRSSRRSPHRPRHRYRSARHRVASLLSTVLEGEEVR